MVKVENDKYNKDLEEIVNFYRRLKTVCGKLENVFISFLVFIVFLISLGALSVAAYCFYSLGIFQTSYIIFIPVTIIILSTIVSAGFGYIAIKILN